MSQTRILVVGAGAIGAFYAARLSAASASTSLGVVCRSNYAVVRERGFALSSAQYGPSTFRPRHVFRSSHDARASGVAWDYILVCTKALPDVEDGSKHLVGLVGPSTAIVLIQNGLGIEQPYAARFPSAPILSVVTFASVSQLQPGAIEHHGVTRTSVGPFVRGNATDQDQQAARAKCERLVHLLAQGGIADAAAYDHAALQLIRWHKVAVNATISPASVLSGGPSNSALAQDPDMSQHLLGIMHEVLDAAPKILRRPFPAQGFASPESIVKGMQKFSASIPSMLLDWKAGRPMELEVILGNPLRIAQQHGLEMPRLQTLYALLKMAQASRDMLQSQQSQL